MQFLPMRIACNYCGKIVDKKPYEIKKAKFHFCSNSCRSKFYNRGANHPRARAMKLGKKEVRKLLDEYRETSLTAEEFAKNKGYSWSRLRLMLLKYFPDEFTEIARKKGNRRGQGDKLELPIEYIAGLFDGEGSVSIQKRKPRGRGESPNYILTVCLGFRHGMDILQKIKKHYGGIIHIVRYGKLKERAYPRWYATYNQAYRFLKDILPFLIIKRKAAELGIKFREEKKKRTGRKLTEAEIRKREDMRLKLKELNHL